MRIYACTRASDIREALAYTQVHTAVTIHVHVRRLQAYGEGRGRQGGSSGRRNEWRLRAQYRQDFFIFAHIMDTRMPERKTAIVTQKSACVREINVSHRTFSHSVVLSIFLLVVSLRSRSVSITRSLALSLSHLLWLFLSRPLTHALSFTFCLCLILALSLVLALSLALSSLSCSRALSFAFSLARSLSSPPHPLPPPSFPLSPALSSTGGEGTLQVPTVQTASHQSDSTRALAVPQTCTLPWEFLSAEGMPRGGSAMQSPGATHCIILQHTASHCNMLQRTATHSNAPRCTLQHKATRAATCTAAHCS